MTNLESVIIEAADCGEIDIDTRNTMLNILIEAANDEDVQESADDDVTVDDIRKEIYERELTGEITIEEREELLDYLDNCISESDDCE